MNPVVAVVRGAAAGTDATGAMSGVMLAWSVPACRAPRRWTLITSYVVLGTLASD